MEVMLIRIFASIKKVTRTTIVYTIFLFLAVPITQAKESGPDSLRSPILNRLKKDIAERNHGTQLDKFWHTVEKSGAPLVEPGSKPGYKLVTFIFRGGDDITQVRLYSEIDVLVMKSVKENESKIGLLSHLPKTDVWYLSMELRTDLRAPYRFLVKRKGANRIEKMLDPLNGKTLAPGTHWAHSIVELPDAPPQPWRNVSPEGHWKKITFTSKALGKSRTVYVYLPSDYLPDRTKPYPILLGMDSYGFKEPLLPANKIIEYLAKEHKIPETVMVLTEDVGPNGDFYGYDPVVSFLADEVLPEVKKVVNITSDPSDIIISGSSRRGLVASYAAFKRPDVFGKVLSLSGSFYWRPPGSEEFGWLPHLYAVTKRQPIRLYLAAGKLETFVSDENAGNYLLGTNRRMRDVLIAKDYDFKYVEFMGIHSEVNWEDQLAAGLKWLWAGSF